MIEILIFLFAPALLVLFDFVRFISTGKRLYPSVVEKSLEVILIIGYPLLYLGMLDSGIANDCCADDVTFSPEHRLSIYTLIIICVLSFFYTSYRKRIAPPLLEVIINCVLILGVLLNVFIAIHVEELYGLFNLPLILLFILSLAQNQKMVISEIKSMEIEHKSGFEKTVWKFLNLKLLFKVPLLFVLSLPVFLLITTFLMLFGQKPDSMIAAFTDTYKHGLSQLDYMCDNVYCGDHFLCSVGANGHKQLVKPIRYGERNGGKIICTRQLLVSNAFEELIEEKFPKTHSIIRQQYNKAGNVIHKHYHIFNIKLVSDFVYVLMKPLELLFLFILYTCDKKPENRIATQYLSQMDKEKIKSINALTMRPTKTVE